jgi:hypothetical protein
MERRRNLRFESQLECRLRRVGGLKSLEGTTINVSRSGALILIQTGQLRDSSAMPQPGDRLQVELLLPAHDGFGRRCLSCTAIAVRSNWKGSNGVVAVQFNQVGIRKMAERPVMVSAEAM